jgi:DNA polymerase III subunit delta'
MPIHPLAGHHPLRERLAQSLKGDRLPKLLLFIGPQGVGKQRLALWLGQRLLCTSPAEVEPCGSCPSCRQVQELTYPDLHWFFPLPRPKAGESDKQQEELAESLGKALEDRRSEGVWGAADGLAGHFMATSQLILKRASLTPASGKRKVFIIGEAERLVPQESSPEAANALLKLFEEPPADSWIILTAADPSRILGTIRSRAVTVRVPPVSETEVRGFLMEYAKLTGRDLDDRARMSGGSIGAALAESKEMSGARRAADEVIAAVAAGAQGRLERALRQPSFAARGDFTAMLDALALRIEGAIRSVHGTPGGEALPSLAGASGETLVTMLERVQKARATAQGNVNPQLLLAVLGQELATAAK